MKVHELITSTVWRKKLGKTFQVEEPKYTKVKITVKMEVKQSEGGPLIR